MALGERQEYILGILAKSPDGSMSYFNFVEELGQKSASSLFKKGFVIGTQRPGTKVTITQAGRDALSPPIYDPFGLG